MLEIVEEIVETVDNAIATKRKRHIIGGVFLSVSLLFAGLAVTAITLKQEENDE